MTLGLYLDNYRVMEKSEIIRTLSALAQETRLDIVRFLVRKGPDGANSGAIGAYLKIPSATLAFHLNILTEARILSRQRYGRQKVYRIDFGELHNMIAYLLENCCADVGELAPELQSLRAS